MGGKGKRGKGHAREVLAANVRARMLARYRTLPNENQRILKLERESGVSRPTIQRILKCSHATTVDMIEDLAMALRCETHELLMEPEQAEPR